MFCPNNIQLLVYSLFQDYPSTSPSADSSRRLNSLPCRTLEPAREKKQQVLFEELRCATAAARRSHLHGGRSVEVLVAEVLSEVDFLVFFARLKRRSKALLAVVPPFAHSPVSRQVPAGQTSFLRRNTSACSTNATNKRTVVVNFTKPRQMRCESGFQTNQRSCAIFSSEI